MMLCRCLYRGLELGRLQECCERIKRIEGEECGLLDSLLCIQNTVHDALEERFETAHGDLVIRVGANGEQEQDYAGK